MKIVIAMDSFKGSLTSLQAGNAVRRGILRMHPDAEIIVLPLADGGEGTVDAIAGYIGGIAKTLTVRGPLNVPVNADYIYDPKTRMAYIEMAKASGLTLIDQEDRDPYITTTYGTGELMADAIACGAEKLVICIGGSATNDGGAGMLQALGARLTDKDGNIIGPGAAGLKDLCSIDLSGLTGRDLDITVACDVTNPLCGPEGASFVYGPQKGASEEACKEIDGWLMHYAETAGFDPFEEGTGAAGGMSFALKNFLGARLMSGADIVMNITGAESRIKDCDIVITGEGRMDSQTVNGKAPFKILQNAKKYGKPVYGITGILGDGYEECLKAGFTCIEPLIDPTMVTEEAVKSVEETAVMLFRSFPDNSPNMETVLKR
ncbi:MAG: glycerate kinase [Clostridiales bacterium]|nr:glycerate kinase [Clostridiales bacterium]